MKKKKSTSGKETDGGSKAAYRRNAKYLMPPESNKALDERTNWPLTYIWKYIDLPEITPQTYP